MIIKWLSQDMSLVPLLKEVSNREARTAPKYAHYLGLFYLMMAHKRYRNFFRDFGFAKKSNDQYKKEEINATSYLWNVSPEKAISILDDLSKEQITKLVKYSKRVDIYVK